MSEKLMSKKKPSYPVNERFLMYLERYNRTTKIPISYDDLLRFSGSVVVYDEDDNDTLWIRVYYSEFERPEIDYHLKQVYTLIFSDGNEDTFQYLNIDAIDFCTFGNSQPFRIKVRNVLNDNYTYIYVKKADASRIYGLELEHILSPNRMNFAVYHDTLIEEHISGIPGDEFIKSALPSCTDIQKSQIAKEFVKFNERCMIRLLGDMRSYNYVIIPVHDFDNVIFKIRAIDFDQQSYEGNFKVYKPQFFKENNKMVQMVQERLKPASIEQYKKEERSLLAKRILTSKKRLKALLRCMINDHITTPENLEELKEELYNYTLDVKFKRCRSMGQVVRVALEFVRRNYEDVSMKRLLHGS
ncbi:hypothetical protein [Galbibacter orientalis]|uniref:Uncharacterized protein n=1 Tax=Galbibacter orientalis DSM 19592 TaxID=926559 RepID=I3C0V1_9FLAO|nr:hypothetical protein [Galbibacter orientalis]EIJ37244.1 hypothetical protein JoomaDRAFT_0184 [Galbibacter orientalis DSM 19592]